MYELGELVIVPLEGDVMLKRESLKYDVQGKGGARHQVPASFVGETPTPIEGTPCPSECGGFFEPMAWKVTTKLVNEEKIEANSVL